MNGKTAFREARRLERQPVSLDVLVAIGYLPLMTLTVANMTEQGMFLLANKRPLPDVGAEVVLTMEALLLQPEPGTLKGMVVHKNKQGIGIELLGPAT